MPMVKNLSKQFKANLESSNCVDIAVAWATSGSALPRELPVTLRAQFRIGKRDYGGLPFAAAAPVSGRLSRASHEAMATITAWS